MLNVFRGIRQQSFFQRIKLSIDGRPTKISQHVLLSDRTTPKAAKVWGVGSSDYHDMIGPNSAALKP